MKPANRASGRLFFRIPQQLVWFFQPQSRQPARMLHIWFCLFEFRPTVSIERGPRRDRPRALSRSTRVERKGKNREKSRKGGRGKREEKKREGKLRAQYVTERERERGVTKPGKREVTNLNFVWLGSLC